jgi:hypothetical protein
MISFLTLFLGLIAGSQPVEVSVAGRVAAVEFLLDGASAGRPERPPWFSRVDFGTELEPHELVARALDEKGLEIGRARQWVNLPRPPAEIEILLERDEKGRAVAGRLAAESLLGPKPLSLSASFDRKPVRISEGRRFEIPLYDADSTHLLTVSADFSNGVRTRRDLVLGGHSSAVSSELTAIPVRLSADTASPPEPASLGGAFVKNGSRLAVVAIEHGAAQVLIVRALSADEALGKLGRGGRTTIDQTQIGAVPVYEPEAMRFQMSLPEEDHVRFVWPRARAVPAANPPAELFDTSHEFTAKDGGLHWLLTRVYHPARVEAHPRFADAVAIAGLQAVGSHGRRAVILVIGKKGADDSRHEAASVRRYLTKLCVPLFVWSLDKSGSGAAAWQDAEDISTLPKLRTAFERFRKALDAQWIVWLSGEHRPQDIGLSEAAKGIELVR